MTRYEYKVHPRNRPRRPRGGKEV